MAAVTELVSFSSVLRDADDRLRSGQTAAARVWQTGFDPLDTYLSGGLRSGELTLLGGPQGLGKTTFALQVLRHVVAGGDAAVLFSFEHDASTLLERLVALEAARVADIEGVPLRRVREAMEVSGGVGGLAERLSGAPGGAEAVAAVAEYGDRLHLHRSNGATTSLAVIRETVQALTVHDGRVPFVVVDYLQKVAGESPDQHEDERVTHVVEGLKDLALELEVPVLAVVAADRDGLTVGRRLRVHHLRGSSSLAYEADVVLLMNDKYDVVARHHLMYDPGNAERFRNFVVLSVEKNRTGLGGIDLEFRKRFEQGRFETTGAPVAEQLVDERVHGD